MFLTGAVEANDLAQEAL